MTKRENFVTLRNLVADNAEMVAFIDNEIALLDKRYNSKANRSTKRQEENKVLYNKIAQILTSEGQTATQILNRLNDDTLTNQRISRALKDMNVKKEVVKGKSLFSLS